MYLLYAPPKKFGVLPSKTPILSDEVLFSGNVAFCPKHYWKKHHVLRGCRDVSPRWMKRLRRHRTLNKILFVVGGGFGDVMWTMPVMEELRRRHPRANIVIAATERTMPIFQNVPFANSCVSDVFWNLSSLIHAADEVYDFGGIATILRKEMKMEPVEACFHHVGIPKPKDKNALRPHLVATHAEGQAAEKVLRENGISPEKDTIITIGLEASTPNRNWPFSYVRELSARLRTEGKKVIWLSAKEDFTDMTISTCACGNEFVFSSKAPPTALGWKCPQCGETTLIEKFLAPEGVVNLAGKTNIRQAMAIIALSNVFVGPCSGLMVVATSFRVPTVGLFGAFSPKRIGKHYEKFSGLWGRSKCAPCNEHWTECREGYPAPCMKLIGPAQVHSEVKRLLKEHPRPALSKRPID